jgi:hypothetical protein
VTVTALMDSRNLSLDAGMKILILDYHLENIEWYIHGMLTEAHW